MRSSKRIASSPVRVKPSDGYGINRLIWCKGLYTYCTTILRGCVKTSAASCLMVGRMRNEARYNDET